MNVARKYRWKHGYLALHHMLSQHQQLHQSRLVESIYPSSIEYQNTLSKLTEYFLQRGSSHLDAQQQAIAFIGQTSVAAGDTAVYIDMFAMLGTLAIILMAIVLILLRTGAAEAQHNTPSH